MLLVLVMAPRTLLLLCSIIFGLVVVQSERCFKALGPANVNFTYCWSYNHRETHSVGMEKNETVVLDFKCCYENVTGNSSDCMFVVNIERMNSSRENLTGVITLDADCVRRRLLFGGAHSMLNVLVYGNVTNPWVDEMADYTRVIRSSSDYTVYMMGARQEDMRLVGNVTYEYTAGNLILDCLESPFFQETLTNNWMYLILMAVVSFLIFGETLYRPSTV
ncbi:membrane glycoprotein UL40 [Saimiriine betaherpesvirus 4]|uniref:Membrane glycoprotein UL40 n=1 Tax=Saimiriine betaherpesvirus 4 TaxID=1535247 RepID=G8XSV3_9BETA|nr:membrane glycoprotein UL40 [Saimiriine betaherpesvirus 4]AEV80900.1 membrane glycoprotein UL40 [Saimiriine betaherpesvirus 4]